MSLQFSTTSEVSVNNGVKMLIYGRSGAGKTMLTATAPAPLMLSAESGLLSLSKANQIRVFKKHVDIPIILIRTLEDLMEAYQFVTESEHAKDFQTVVLDSATEIAEVVLNHAKANSKDPRQAYGDLIDKMGVVFRSFRDIQGKHVVFIAKEETRGQNDATLYGPAMPGSKLSQQVPYLFDEVFHMGVGETPEKVKYRFLQTNIDLQYDAKDRSGALEFIEEPDLTKIINKITRH